MFTFDVCGLLSTVAAAAKCVDASVKTHSSFGSMETNQSGVSHCASSINLEKTSV